MLVERDESNTIVFSLLVLDVNVGNMFGECHTPCKEIILKMYHQSHNSVAALYDNK